MSRLQPSLLIAALLLHGAVPVAEAADPPTTAMAAGTGLDALVPVRVVDTRDGVGARTVVPRVASRIQLTGRNGIPADTEAVSANFTVTQPSDAGYLTVWDCASQRPVVATVNFGAGETVPNAASVSLDATGGICVFSTVATDLVVDVNGVYRSAATGRFSAITPIRLMDTRVQGRSSGRIEGGATVALQVAGVQNLPAQMEAVALNVASIDPSQEGFITVYPCDADRPLSANLNPVPGHVKPNLVLTSLSADGRVCVYTSSTVDLVVDATGYVSPESPATFTPTAPFRFTDTRERTRVDVNAGSGGSPLDAGEVLTIQFAGRRGIPANAAGLAANIAVTEGDEPGFVTAYPCGERPNTANVNFATATSISSGAQIPLSADGQLCVYAYRGAHVIIDVTGWWSDPAGTPAAAPLPTTPGAVPASPTPGMDPSPTPVAPSPAPPAVPALYWGAYIEGAQTYGAYYGGSWSTAPWDTRTWDKFEQNAGKKVSLLHYGQPPPWVQPFTPAVHDAVIARGAIPLINTSSGNASLRDIAAGVYDASITAWAKAVKAWGKPMFFRWNWEMNGTWFPWGAQAHANPADYVNSWRRFHDIVAAAGATNVSWVWNPNIVTPVGTPTPIAQLYPGDAYVDWTAIDGYNWGTQWLSFEQIFRSTYNALLTLAPSKPIMIAETGSAEIGGSKAAWINDMFAALPTFPAIRAIVWFNWRSSERGTWLEWPIESSASAQAAFSQGIRSARFATNSYANLTGGPIRPPN